MWGGEGERGVGSVVRGRRERGVGSVVRGRRERGVGSVGRGRRERWNAHEKEWRVCSVGAGGSV